MCVADFRVGWKSFDGMIVCVGIKFPILKKKVGALNGHYVAYTMGAWVLPIRY